jgi:hypothetical protein
MGGEVGKQRRATCTERKKALTTRELLCGRDLSVACWFSHADSYLRFKWQHQCHVQGEILPEHPLYSGCLLALRHVVLSYFPTLHLLPGISILIFFLVSLSHLPLASSPLNSNLHEGNDLLSLWLAFCPWNIIFKAVRIWLALLTSVTPSKYLVHSRAFDSSMYPCETKESQEGNSCLFVKVTLW